MRQVLAIHGGDSFPTYEGYLKFLKEFPLSIEPRSKGWKSRLPESLGDSYEVVLPSMPNSSNAKYEEWKIWFEKYIPFMNNDIILIGHSLGGVFLAKYLSEEKLPVSILATFLVAAPYDTDGEFPLPEFAPGASLELLAQQGGEIYLYHSNDDPVVAISEYEKYAAKLPNAHRRVFLDREHFTQEDLPEIIEDIKALGT